MLKKHFLDSGNSAIDLALNTISIGKQAFVFVNTKSSAEKTAEETANKIDKNNEELNELSDKIEHVLSKPTKQCERLARCVKKGIAFHHSGLTNEQKSLIEDSFRSGLIKIICCTPTLAAGVDLPAYRVIIRDLRRFSFRGYVWIPVLEYMQMAGRAGRPSFDKKGQAIVIAKTEKEKEKIVSEYINGEAEEIYSKLAVEPILRMYLLSLIATEFVNTKKSVMEFFSKTFYAHQFKDLYKIESIIMKILGLLEEWGFIKVNELSGRDSQKWRSASGEVKRPNEVRSPPHPPPPSTRGFVSASELNEDKEDDYSIKSTLLGRRVAELYIDPLTAHHIIDCLKKSDKEVSAVSLLQMICNTLEMRPLLRVKVKEYDDVQAETLNYSFLEQPDTWNEDYEDWLKSVKTAFFFNDWINENDDEYLLEKYNIRPGETRAKLERANWLLYSASELSRMIGLKNILKNIVKLRFRIRYGVKEELLALLKLEGIGRVRARKLFNNGVKTIGDVKKSDVVKLVQLIGKKTAVDIKKQVGQEIKEVPKGKRKGQLSLRKYGVCPPARPHQPPKQ